MSDYVTLSFRGAGEAREPGIHNPGCGVWIPGPPLTRRPGMTEAAIIPPPARA